MAESEDTQEEKFDFTSEGEAQPYISLAQARLLAMQTARETPGNYGRKFSDMPMVFTVTESGEDEDYYTVILSFRPEAGFTGTPGREQFFISKEGEVVLRQVLDPPRGKLKRRLLIIAGIAVFLVAAVLVATMIFGSKPGPFTGAPPVTPTTAPTFTAVPNPTPTPNPTPAPTSTEIPVVVIPATNTTAPTETPMPTPIATIGSTDTPPSESTAPTATSVSKTPGSRSKRYASPPLMGIDPDRTYSATIRTNQGDMVLELFPSSAPKTVNNFVFLADAGYYNGIIFHRVIPDFMIQGGDPTGTGTSGPGYQFEDEIDPALVFDRPGVLAMANAGPNTNGSQFFITTVPTPHLNGNHTIFGRILDGQDVADRISKVPFGPGNKPLEAVVIEEIVIVETPG